MIKRLIGFSRGCADLKYEDFIEFKNSGIDCLELAQGLAGNEADLHKLKQYAEECNIFLRSYHLPFYPFETMDISCTDDVIRRSAVEYQKQCIKKASEIGIKIFVVHPSVEPIAESDRKNHLECSKKSLKELAEYASEFGAVIAVEDLPRTCLGNCSREINELISADNRLGVCFDTNHLTKEAIPDFIKNVGSRIITTHFSDYDFIDERHWLPGEGDINWVELMDLLDSIGYDGSITYEVSCGKEVKLLTREHPLNSFDIKKNFTELENRVKPTTFCKRQA